MTEDTRVKATDNTNLYAPPQAQIAETSLAADRTPFYVVSPTKVVLLMMATFGLYALYWFWRHWKLHKIEHKLDLWPVPRAIFSIFFAHSLNQEIDHRLQRSGARHVWSPNGWATLFVAAAILGRILGRMPETLLSTEANIGLMLLTLVGTSSALAQAQRAANIACGDPLAVANRRFTAANYVWLILGALLWALILLGLMLPDDPSLM